MLPQPLEPWLPWSIEQWWSQPFQFGTTGHYWRARMPYDQELWGGWWTPGLLEAYQRPLSSDGRSGAYVTLTSAELEHLPPEPIPFGGKEVSFRVVARNFKITVPPYVNNHADNWQVRGGVEFGEGAFISASARVLNNNMPAPELHIELEVWYYDEHGNLDFDYKVIPSYPYPGDTIEIQAVVAGGVCRFYLNNAVLHSHNVPSGGFTVGGETKVTAWNAQVNHSLSGSQPVVSGQGLGGFTLALDEPLVPPRGRWKDTYNAVELFS